MLTPSLPSHTSQGRASDRGFTLVELLIVIVILGILATVTVFAVQGITGRGRSAACDSDKKTLQQAIESYYAVNQTLIAPTEAQLVSAGLLVSNSPNFDVNAIGDVVPQAGNSVGCQ
ncbi:MAG: prepilin-type N-terminal cleavage/methylation domain-containing protein [Actinomycetota bacterium]